MIGGFIGKGLLFKKNSCELSSEIVKEAYENT